VDELGNTIGLGKAQYGSDKVDVEKRSVKQKALVHYDYLYMEKTTNS
jgi:glutamate 5-kinase